MEFLNCFVNSISYGYIVIFNSRIFLCKTGKVLACGWSADGQTGVSHYDNQEEPAEVMGDIQGEKIVKVATSADCVLAINGT